MFKKKSSQKILIFFCEKNKKTKDKTLPLEEKKSAVFIKQTNLSKESISTKSFLSFLTENFINGTIYLLIVRVSFFLTDKTGIA